MRSVWLVPYLRPRPGNRGISVQWSPRLGRRRREDIKAIRVEYRGPKSTRRNTIELNRSCFYRTGLVESWDIDRSGPLPPRACTVSLCDAGRATPASFPLRQPCAFFTFFCFPVKNLHISKFDDFTHHGHKARHAFTYIIYVCVYVCVCVCV